MKIANITFIFIILGVGCQSGTSLKQMGESEVSPVVTQSEISVEVSDVQLPVDEYVDRRHKKAFGEYIDDRFTGYHVGDDIEFVDVTKEVPVYAISDGMVREARTVAGYGGLIVIEHVIAGESIMAHYGHVDIVEANVSVGDAVKRGDEIAHLGDHESTETDGERKHLHFGLYAGSEIKLAGYEATESGVKNWMNPQNFFSEHGIDMTTLERSYSAESEAGENIYNLTFTVPEGMEVEFVPSIESLNIFTLEGGGTARDRSQIFIRYFDASSFLTLSTVTIYQTTDMTVGKEDYTARRYDIEKKSSASDFADQPDWRNDRHVVTDFRPSNGFTRYYVVASNPDLSSALYEEVLTSIVIE